ncbi:hypothetical protein [Oceanospirillum sediminis]|uniref:Uncharacterized protein n=1 Tax=Oceanospirillum sediminis TaxID=2760088 RepID=A0A839INX8_9GAMM|nr:hypothetical protein [Oceanospirillum sediminis]MBB1486648.1 hypothetical protein [Oceanospirillum sediminis]
MSETDRDTQDTAQEARLAEPEHFSLFQQLETRERLVRLEEENKHLKELIKEQGEKQKNLRSVIDDLRTEQTSQLNERAWKLGQRIDTLARRLDRLFGFWMLSTMLMILFVVVLMFKAGV